MKRDKVIRKKDESGETCYKILKFFFFNVESTTRGTLDVPYFNPREKASKFIEEYL